MNKAIVAIAVVFTIIMASSVIRAEPADATVDRPITEEEWTPETRLWLSRSVLGEAGWRRPDEYSAIAWVYVTRVRQTKQFTFLKMVRTYSAAVRGRKNKQNPWLYELVPDVTKRPRSWPVDEHGLGPLWKGLHDKAWQEVLEWADEWAVGKRPNPCLGANHYGGWVDRHRAVAKRWTRIKCESKMRNRFYNSHKLVPEGRGGRWHRG